MSYFEAVRQGRARVQEAVDLLQQVAGPSYPMLFLRTGSGPWTPVGPEMLCAVVEGKAGTAAVVICDSEGNAKAMTSWLPKGSADGKAMLLESKGVAKFKGEVRLPI